MFQLIFTISMIIFPSMSWADPVLGNHPPITEWKNQKVEKGFVLYTYLVNQSGCFDNDIVFVWDYHAFAFKKRNPNILNINELEVGTEILLQTCQPVLVKKELEKPIESVPETPVELVGSQSEEVDSSPDKSEQDPFENSRLFVGLGFLTESHEDLLITDPALTFRIKSDFHNTLNHRLKLDVSPSVIYVRNKIDIKTPESKYQFFLSLGLGNRIGVQRRVDPKMSTTITNYSEASLGFNVKYSSTLNISMEAGTTLNSRHPVNFSVTAMKKLGKSDYYLGGFFDYVWTDSSILLTDTNDRRLITSGIIFSY